MTFTYDFKEVLKEYHGYLYKMLLIKITYTDGKFKQQSLPMRVAADDSTDTVYNFMYGLSGNQKELDGYFTTDAFSGFGPSATIRFGYGKTIVAEITGADLTTPVPLSSYLSSQTYTDADNAWLAAQ